MKKLVLFSILILTLSFSQNIQAQPGWYYTNTGVNHTILVPSTALMTVNGIPLEVGDYVGVFYDSLGTLACGGYLNWQGVTSSIAAWGADAIGGGNNGFSNGELFKWKIWKASSGVTYNANATYSAMGFPNTSSFSGNGMSGIATLTATIGVDLAAGPLVSPSNGCSGLGNNEVIGFQIFNLGNNTVNAFTISYSFNGGTVYTESVTTPIPADSSLIYYSANPVDLSVPGIYEFSLTINVPNDITPENNTLVTTLVNQPVIQAAFTMTDTSFCASGQSIILSATPSGGLFTSISTSIIGNNGIYSVVFNQPGTFILDYTYTDTNNCTSAASQEFVIQSAPFIDLGTTPPFCQGDTFILNPSGNYSTYIWSDGSSTSSLSVTTSGTYSVTVTNNNDCEANDDITLTFNALPQINISGDSTLCEGGTVSLSVNNPLSTYIWSNGVSNNTITVDSAGVYTVTVTSLGCSSSASVLVVEYPNPSVPTGTEVGGCEGEIITLEAGVWLAYQWSTGETSPSIQVTQAGNYSVTIYNQYLCSSSYNIGVYFNPLAVAGFTYAIDEGNVQFTSTSQNETAGSYQWHFGDGASSGQQNPLHSYALSGTYNASLTVSNDCGDDTYTESLTISLSDEENEMLKAIQLFPNPANEQVQLIFPANHSFVQWSLKDVNGRVVMSESIQAQASLQINLEDLASGSYFIQLISKSGAPGLLPLIKQ